MQLVLIASVILVVIGVIYGAVWYFVGTMEDAALQGIHERARGLERERALSSLETMIAETAADRAELKEFVLTDAGVTEFLALVEDSARNRGLRATTKSVAIEPDDDLFESLRVEIEVEGRYAGVNAFLSILETLPYMITLSSVRFDQSGEGIWRGSFIFGVTKEKSI